MSGQKHLILQEDRSCILKLSLQKLRFLEDPEAYLRRSVLINNLLRKIHHHEGGGEEEEEEEESGEEDEEDVENEECEEVEEKEEVAPVVMESAKRRLPLCPDGAKVKVLVMECCSPAFGLENLSQYQLMPCCPGPGCLYGLRGCSCLGSERRLLLYNLDNNS